MTDQNECYILTRRTKWIFGNDRRVLCSSSHTKLVLSKDSEDVLLKLDEARGFVGGLFDGGGQAVPDLAVHSSALHDVVGDSRAAIIAWRIPGEEARLVCDLGYIKGGRRTGLICEESSQVNRQIPKV